MVALFELMRIENTDERKFYKIESAKSGGAHIRTAENKKTIDREPVYMLPCLIWMMKTH